MVINLNSLKLEELRKEVKSCNACELCKTRTNTVFGMGTINTDLLFVGEAPGRTEDEQGLPFVGRSGQLLDKMLAAVDLFRDKNIFITNIIKCRPPNNADPTPDQQKACRKFLDKQIELIDPKLIVCVGRIAAMSLISPSFRVTKDHGQFFQINNRYIVGTFHPAALLRDPGKKEEAFKDFLKINNFVATLHTS